jgi:hypothetical protein
MKQHPDGLFYDKFWPKEENDGFWNVHTLLEVGKLPHAIAITTSYKIDILGMSGIRWNEFREIKTPSNMLFLYSGRPNAEDEHWEGAGLLLSNGSMFARTETSKRKDNNGTFLRPCPQRYYNTMLCPY